MALTTNTESEIERLDGEIAAIDKKIIEASATLRKHKNKKSKLADMRGRLGAVKAQADRFNNLDRK